MCAEFIFDPLCESLEKMFLQLKKEEAEDVQHQTSYFMLCPL